MSFARHIKDWKSLPDGPEKYQYYLASREWAVLKEAVKRRSGGKCERCKATGMQVHHQTYERKYRERLEDLVHLCVPCHEFLSGKRNDDPFLLTRPTILGKLINNVYLAGKITRDDWRSSIYEYWKYSNCKFEYPHGILKFSTIKNSLYIPDGRNLNFAGPYWWGGNHGDGNTSMYKYSDLPHSNFYYKRDHAFCDHEFERDHLYHVIKSSISGCDMVFAWIESCDCFGTLFEIGYAIGVGVFTVVAYKNFEGPDYIEKEEDDEIIRLPNPDSHVVNLWLSMTCANCKICASTPREAWDRFWIENADK